MWMCGRTKWILGSTLILTEVFGSSVPNSLVANDSGFNIAGNRSGLMRIWRVHTKLFSAPSGLPMVLHPALPWGILSTDTWCLWILSASTCPKTVYSLPSVPSPCGFGKWKQLCDLGVKFSFQNFQAIFWISITSILAVSSQVMLQKPCIKATSAEWNLFITFSWTWFFFRVHSRKLPPWDFSPKFYHALVGCRSWLSGG